MVKSRCFLGMVIQPFNRNPYTGYINPYYWVDDHPLLYGNNVSLDPGTHAATLHPFFYWKSQIGNNPQQPGRHLQLWQL